MDTCSHLCTSTYRFSLPSNSTGGPETTCTSLESNSPRITLSPFASNSLGTRSPFASNSLGLGSTCASLRHLPPTYHFLFSSCPSNSAAPLEGLDATFLRLRRRSNRIAGMTASRTARTTPTAIPAFAPPLRLEDDDATGVGELVCDGNTDELPGEAPAVKFTLILCASDEAYAVGNIAKSFSCQATVIGSAYAVPNANVVRFVYE